MNPPSRWRLCVLVSEHLCPNRDWWRVPRLIVEPSDTQPTVDCIQLREKEIGHDDLLDRAKRLVALCQPRGVSVIINDYPDIARLAGADGVHLGQDDPSCNRVRREVGSALIIGVSTSNLEQAKQARQDGADYCGVGPMFTTTTKQKEVIVGPDYLRQYLAWGELPHLAIGGITVDNTPILVEAGVRGIAVSSAICADGNPAATAEKLGKMLPAK